MSSNIQNGIILINKSKGKSSFSIVSQLRKATNIRKIGHCGTLDPFATGLMIMLVGKQFTKKADQFINYDKEYFATLHLGYSTNTYDSEGALEFCSDKVPAIEEIEKILLEFQGTIKQIPPMFSAKKINGQKLYKLARQGITIERAAVEICVKIDLIKYNYPYLEIKVSCSKGTYIRSLANDIGTALQTGAYLSALNRTRIGPFHLEKALDQEQIGNIENLAPWFLDDNI